MRLIDYRGSVNDYKETMKITKRQLRRIIREAMVTAGTPFSTSPEPDHMDSAEYDRGYQDGLVQYPEDPDAGPDYNAGYEDATLDRARGRRIEPGDRDWEGQV